MNNFFILIVLLFLNLNIYKGRGENTPRVNPKTQYNASFHLKIAKMLSAEIKKMNLTDVKIEHNHKKINLSFSKMKVHRTFGKPDLSKIRFMLFTRENIDNPQCIIADSNDLYDCHFDLTKDLKMIIHDWKSSSLYEGCISIKNNYLMCLDVNVILVDWSDIASYICYPTVVTQTKQVGWYIGSLLNFLIKYGYDPRNIHIIGHGLGAHIAGFATEVIREKLDRITALDPSLPGFVLSTLSHFGGKGRLTTDHANCVDVIHTCGGTFGLLGPIGHVDFYPNGGQTQPGCWIIDFTCSHYRSYDLFDESIGKCTFPAKPCTPGFLADEFLMGEPVAYTARGSYCLNTNDQSPYGILQASHMKRSGIPAVHNGTHLQRVNKEDVKNMEDKACRVKSKLLCICVLINILLCKSGNEI